ncbi:MAG: hypothetical protein GTO02_01000 [Candidatus Dadabacteria bacterium]|nr:hypothetical protein [Candidatus Dadabacteria bacterium]NIQ13020.1 hypothetical protein [Candidatus Dadabacteria bacterium]
MYNVSLRFLLIFIMAFFSTLVLTDNSLSKSNNLHNTPDSVFVGDPVKLKYNVFDKLPTGYKSIKSFKDIPEKIIKKGINSGDPNDPISLVLLDEDTPVKEIMEEATKMGKTTVYFFYKDFWDDPDVLYWEETFDFNELLNKIIYGDNYSLMIDDFLNFLVPEAYADQTLSPSCNSGNYLYQNQCLLVPTIPEGPNDYRYATKYNNICFKYTSRSCHWQPFVDHLLKNLSYYDNHYSSTSKTSAVHCMKAHNGDSFIKHPENLFVNIYKKTSDLSNSCNNCCGIAGVPPKQTPRVSINKSMAIVESCIRNGQNWWIPRHELFHTYGYTHSEMGSYCTTPSTNLDNSRHCCRSSHDYL